MGTKALNIGGPTNGNWMLCRKLLSTKGKTQKQIEEDLKKYDLILEEEKNNTNPLVSGKALKSALKDMKM